MIQLNNVSAGISSPFGMLGSTADPSSSDSFENALSDAVSQTLQKFGINPDSVNISIAPASTAADSSAPAAASANPSAAATAADMSSLAPFTANAVNTSTPPAAQDLPSPQDTEQSFDDAYWANQPAQVQQLRNIGDTGERTLMATQLASEGYKIDVPIMAWGWDPSQVTSLRQSYGYTWVPSALQNPVAVAPGINNPGVQSYDPNNPPAGSITV